jgi:hypothetical protein
MMQRSTSAFDAFSATVPVVGHQRFDAPASVEPRKQLPRIGTALFRCSHGLDGITNITAVDRRQQA